MKNKLKHVYKVGKLLMEFYEKNNIKNRSVDQFKNDIDDIIFSTSLDINNMEKIEKKHPDELIDFKTDNNDLSDDSKNELNDLLNEYNDFLYDLTEFLNHAYDVLPKEELTTFNEILIDEMLKIFLSKNDIDNLKKMLGEQSLDNPTSPNTKSDLHKSREQDTNHYIECKCYRCQEYRQMLHQTIIYEDFLKLTNYKMIYIP